jgi:hypothetical protein
MSAMISTVMVVGVTPMSVDCSLTPEHDEFDDELAPVLGAALVAAAAELD